MNLFQQFRNIRPFVRPYRLLVALTLILTLVGLVMQQVNAIVLDRTVIIISHSISQIIDSDMIYALREGRVEESGDPDEIYKKEYRKDCQDSELIVKFVRLCGLYSLQP